jgi:hypothetical protein
MVFRVFPLRASCALLLSLAPVLVAQPSPPTGGSKLAADDVVSLYGSEAR